MDDHTTIEGKLLPVLKSAAAFGASGSFLLIHVDSVTLIQMMR